MKNQSLQEAPEYVARSAAKVALRKWYETGYYRANAQAPRDQQEENLLEVAKISGWLEKKVFIANRNETTPAFFTYKYNSKPNGRMKRWARKLATMPYR